MAIIGNLPIIAYRTAAIPGGPHPSEWPAASADSGGWSDSPGTAIFVHLGRRHCHGPSVSRPRTVCALSRPAAGGGKLVQQPPSRTRLAQAVLIPSDAECGRCVLPTAILLEAHQMETTWLSWIAPCGVVVLSAAPD